ncbi:hypothetical protein PQQ53_21375 [Paraburkholderia strydomiana]|uniref:hypothetical protein n=1 Tax=Paraburkholderia strydomiana TaxID=1245417 RepID=UPI0038B9B0DF
MTTPTNARTLSADEYAASKAAYLKDASSGKVSATTPQEYTPEQRRALIDADIAAIEAGGPKFAAVTEATGNTSNTAQKPKPGVTTPTNARDMSDTVYAQWKRDYLASARG